MSSACVANVLDIKVIHLLYINEHICQSLATNTETCCRVTGLQYVFNLSVYKYI